VSAFSISAGDSVASVIGELRARETGSVEDPKFGALTLKRGLSNTVSFWEGRYVWRADCSLVTIRIAQVAGADLPTAQQREFIEDLEARYAYFRAGALVLLKPAFRQYIGEQARLKTMLEEFLLTGVTVPNLATERIEHEFLYRCTTDPAKAFYVTFENLLATKVRVDETDGLTGLGVEQ
jgi:hypothetical protein